MSLPRGFLGRFFPINDLVSLLISGSKELHGPPDKMIDRHHLAKGSRWTDLRTGARATQLVLRSCSRTN